MQSPPMWMLSARSILRRTVALGLRTCQPCRGCSHADADSPQVVIEVPYSATPDKLLEWLTITKHTTSVSTPGSESRHAADVARHEMAYAISPRLRTPQLLIGITGGARDFVLTNRLRETLRSGLRRATDVTDSWIVTGGTNCGIMKVRGELLDKRPSSNVLPACMHACLPSMLWTLHAHLACR